MSGQHSSAATCIGPERVKLMSHRLAQLPMCLTSAKLPLSQVSVSLVNLVGFHAVCG